jgi:AcrR family transcriptional regulator
LDAILDAAEGVVLSEGMGYLTLDAVARRAGLSKAGLLHHVSSKAALVDAMVRRQIVAWHAEFVAAYERQRGAGSVRPAIDAMMSTCLSGLDSWGEAERARNRVLVAALVHDERCVEPLREVSRSVSRLIAQDAAAPAVGETIHLAVHGLWFEWIFGLGAVTPARLAAVRGVLEGLANAGAGAGQARNGRNSNGRVRSGRARATTTRGAK